MWLNSDERLFPVILHTCIKLNWPTWNCFVYFLTLVQYFRVKSRLVCDESMSLEASLLCRQLCEVEIALRSQIPSRLQQMARTNEDAHGGKCQARSSLFVNQNIIKAVGQNLLNVAIANTRLTGLPRWNVFVTRNVKLRGTLRTSKTSSKFWNHVNVGPVLKLMQDQFWDVDFLSDHIQ